MFIKGSRSKFRGNPHVMFYTQMHQAAIKATFKILKTQCWFSAGKVTTYKKYLTLKTIRNQQFLIKSIQCQECLTEWNNFLKYLTHRVTWRLRRYFLLNILND